MSDIFAIGDLAKGFVIAENGRLFRRARISQLHSDADMKSESMSNQKVSTFYQGLALILAAFCYDERVFVSSF